MSHFTVLVAAADETELATILDPFDENKDVDPYTRECYCVNSKAYAAGCASADAGVGSIDSFRERYHDFPDPKPNWEAFIQPWVDAREMAEKAHPLYQKPDPECEECNGTGTRETTYNPKSKWDWYQVGGRFRGCLLLKPQKVGAMGEPSWTNEGGADVPDTADIALAGDIDWEGMHTRSREARRKEHRNYHEIINQHLPEEQERHALFTEGLIFIDNDITQLTEDEYVEKHDNGLTWAFINEKGEWIEKSEMGWWGLHGDETASYGKAFWAYVQSLPPDATVYIIDAHI